MGLLMSAGQYRKCYKRYGVVRWGLEQSSLMRMIFPKSLQKVFLSTCFRSLSRYGSNARVKRVVHFHLSDPCHSNFLVAEGIEMRQLQGGLQSLCQTLPITNRVVEID